MWHFSRAQQAAPKSFIQRSKGFRPQLTQGPAAELGLDAHAVQPCFSSAPSPLPLPSHQLCRVNNYVICPKKHCAVTSTGVLGATIVGNAAASRSGLGWLGFCSSTLFFAARSARRRPASFVLYSLMSKLGTLREHLVCLLPDCLFSSDLKNNLERNEEHAPLVNRLRTAYSSRKSRLPDPRAA